MIQFNLLPDVKLEYIRARKLKRTVILLSSTIAAASMALVIILFLAVVVFQKKHLNDLSRDIKTESQQLQNSQDLNKILTVQNQLNSLKGLYASVPVTSRLFGYIQQITPSTATIAELDLDFTQQTMSIRGSADSLGTINKYADTIKFTTYKASDDSQKSAFSSVVLTNFVRSSSQSDYEISMKFDPAIFDAGTNITSLTIPANYITTRSQMDSPSDLFKTNTSGN